MSFPQRIESHSDGSIDWDINIADNLTGFMRVGLVLDGPWRVEAELGVHDFKIDGVEGFPPIYQPIGGEGSLDTTTLMGNLIYDIPLGDTPIQPFVGVGGMWTTSTSMQCCPAAPSRSTTAISCWAIRVSPVWRCVSRTI